MASNLPRHAQALHECAHLIEETHAHLRLAKTKLEKFLADCVARGEGLDEVSIRRLDAITASINETSSRMLMESLSAWSNFLEGLDPTEGLVHLKGMIEKTSADVDALIVALPVTEAMS